MSPADKQKLIEFCLGEIDIGYIKDNTGIEAPSEDVGEFLDLLKTQCVELFV
jgi:hypothetical protein